MLFFILFFIFFGDVVVKARKLQTGLAQFLHPKIYLLF